MSLTQSVLRNRHAVWAMAIAATLFGARAYLALPMQLFPDTSPPLVNVITAFPGASVNDVADGLYPLEAELAAVEGVSRVRSTAQDNLSLISLEFLYTRPAELAAVDVQNAIARVRARLPAGVREPQVLRFSTADRPVATVGLAAEDLMAARRLAEDVVATRVRQVPGVAAVDVFGGALPAVVIELERRALEAHHLPFPKVLEAVREHNTALPAGRVRTETTQTLFRVESRAERLEELLRIPISTPDGGRVLLGDLAKVRPGALHDDARFGIDGERAIALQIFKTTEANTVEVVRGVKAEVAELSELHPGVRFLEGEETASFTETVVSNLLENVWQALLLAAVIIFLFLGTARGSLVAAVSMPLSYALTFAMMQALGVELNMVTLSAIILAVGMVVDASVVVLENVTRRREEEGLSPERAAREGTDEVLLPVLAGAATTLVVLVPLLFLGGFVGKTFGPLALTLILAFTSSVVVALVFVPVLTLYTAGSTWADRAAAKVSRPFNALMGYVQRFYLLLLEGGLKRPALALGLAVALFVGGVAGIRALGMEVLPKMDGGSFFVSLQTPSGSSLEETERVVQEVEELIRAQPEVVKVQWQVGFEQGMRSFASSGVQGPTQGFISVSLTPRTERPASVWDVQQRVREGLTRIPGIHTSTVRELGNTAKSTTAAPVVVRLSGQDPLVLDQLGGEVAERLAAIPGVVEPTRSWQLDQRRARVEVDALRAGQLGLTPATVAQLMLAGSEGVPAGAFHDDQGSPLPLWVRYASPGQPGADQLLSYPILVPGASAVPLRAIARVEDTVGQGLITREDLVETLEVSAFTRDRPLSFIVSDAERALEALALPRGYTLSLTGEKRDLAEARGELGAALGVAVLAVYLLLVAQFRSFLHPFTVLLSVPLSLSGVAAALAMAGKSISMPVMIGLILLVGTVVNNAILLIDFINRARESGTGRREAVLASVATRFRPIMMTSLSTIIGMVPLAAEWALGAERFSPLATAIVGGMASATLLTLVVIPIAYEVLDGLQQRLTGRVPQAAAAVALLALVLPSSANAGRRLDLEQSVALARLQSRALADRVDERAAAELKRREADARRLPRVDVTTRYSRLSYVEPGAISLPALLPNAPPVEPVRLGEPIEDQVGLRLTVSQPLFTGFALRHASRAAERGAALAEARTAQEEAQLRLEVSEAYFALLQARQLTAVHERSVRTVEAHLGRVEQLIAAGRATNLELSRVKGRLAKARLALAGSQGSAEVARLSFLSLLGLEEGEEVELVEPLEAEAASAAAGVAPERLVARARAELQAERAAASRGALWPQLHLQLGASYDHPNARYFPPRNEFNGSWDATVLLNWAVWDWGASRAAADGAALEATIAERAVAQADEQTRLALRRLEQAARTARERVRVSRDAVGEEEEAHRIASALFAAERVDATEVMEREADLTRARAELISAQAELRVLEARAERLRGRPTSSTVSAR